ncbi:SDR family NAD(P)-dependent oxidoreductase [Cystobacter ferrugineus]|uniref:SDR family oxidoreductase n=1 Tax=Cystobacter ferrugineus TaxID=83449 RepID=A0A1L9B2Z4_9BACT|nr:SDR family NAD(P)-dependent oxidoreductase [Cystobacter ferrugineus]OJH36553.1 SDR family oxidoreductase [Cystobacter ferrugineus]
MADLILTGASRGIGHALALALAARGERLVLVARDRTRLDSLVTRIERQGGHALAVPGDLSSLKGARRLGERLVEVAAPGATLVHNAGLWPSTRELTPEGLETAFVVNHLAPLVMQRSLLEAGRLRRVMGVSAGLIIKGRFDAARTPTGEDFSSLRTYCTTKLCFALALRDVAAAHPELDVVVLHPGVVRTDLGAREGPLGWLLSLVKRGWEAPEVCAARLARLLARERWSPAGEARWLVEEDERPWPAAAEDEATRRAVRDTTARLLG